MGAWRVSLGGSVMTKDEAQQLGAIDAKLDRLITDLTSMTKTMDRFREKEQKLDDAIEVADRFKKFEQRGVGVVMAFSAISAIIGAKFSAIWDVIFGVSK